MPASDPVSAARLARTHAVAPFSGFQVGAVLEADDGRLFGGCNIENASYGLTICAERVAIFKAISEGCRAFTRLVIVADTQHPTPPCGACRQIIWEFCGDIPIIVANLSGVVAEYRTADLLPHPFDRETIT